jgi:hypothetical protein
VDHWNEEKLYFNAGLVHPQDCRADPEVARLNYLHSSYLEVNVMRDGDGIISFNGTATFAWRASISYQDG